MQKKLSFFPRWKKCRQNVDCFPRVFHRGKRKNSRSRAMLACAQAIT